MGMTTPVLPLIPPNAPLASPARHPGPESQAAVGSVRLTGTHVLMEAP